MRKSSVYQAGWRPAYGWLGLVIVLTHMIILPIVSTIGKFYDVDIPVVLIPYGELATILGTILSIAALRSYDKTKGIDTRGFTNYD